MGKRFLIVAAILCIVGLATAYSQDAPDLTGLTWEQVKEKYPTLDTDKDGMSDWWEIKNGLNPLNKFDAKMDLDGDKLNNLQEFKSDTDPKNANLDSASSVSKDWMKFFNITDINAIDASKEGGKTSYKADWDNNLIPNDANSQPEAEGATASQKHPEPSMDGVRENIDPSIPDNHMVRPNVWKYNDPIGDDKGPGYYTYPTNPVYSPGAFDIVSFEVDATSPDYISLKIRVNADLKQDWGMAADFDVQHFQVYIDTDRTPGSGNITGVPGIWANFAPDFAWDRVVLITPQPSERVQVEADVKAKDIVEQIVVPTKIVGQGRTITAVVKKKDLGITADTDISKWAWQVIAQSNEGFPDSDSILARNVNEYRGLHRFGGGSDFFGDPGIIDMLSWPAKGTLQEAKDQFEVLNVWESYPDPKMDVRAVVPMEANDMAAPWKPASGYVAYAKDIASKIKPPAQKDKFVSDNFSLFFKLFTRYNWNLNPANENFVKNSLEVGFEGKAFTDLIGYYMRWEIAKWDNTIWTLWNNDTPGQQPIALQSARCILVKPLPTVDTIAIGNYELDYSPWVMGAAWYPDRDKYKGIFVDGTIENLMNYSFTVHYPLNWIGMDWKHGSFTAQDFAYGLRLMSSAIPNLKMRGVASLYSDWEISPLTSTNGDPKKYVLRGYNTGLEFDANYKMDLGFMSVSVGGVVAYTDLKLGKDFKNLELSLEQDIDNNGTLGNFAQTGSDAGTINMKYETNGFSAVGTLKLDNLLGLFTIVGQGFMIDYNYCAIGSARGDTSFGSVSGFGGSPTADILEMSGSQSVHRAPQVADFISSMPMTGLPTAFLMADPVTTTKGIGWINDTWEGVAAEGWQGGTAIVKFGLDVFRASAELSLINFNNPDYTNKTQLRGNLSMEYALLDLGAKVTLGSKFYNYLNPGKVTNGTGTATVVEKDRSALLLVPAVTYSQKVGKSLTLNMNYKWEMGSYTYGNEIKTNSWATVSTNLNFNRHRVGLGVNYALPIGVIKTQGEWWMEPAGAQVNDFVGRTTYGAYFITEWEYAL